MNKQLKNIFSVAGISVLSLASLTFGSPALAQNQTQTTNQNIIEVAKSNPNLSNAVTAIETANLTSNLQGNGPFTVFIPSNAAFDKIPTSTRNALLNDTNQRTNLTNLLNYHVVNRRIDSNELRNAGSLTTVQGENLNFSLNNNTISINNSTNITTADIQASNGIIHVIDTVLLPNSVTQSLNTLNSTQTDTSSENTSDPALVRTGGLNLTQIGLLFLSGLSLVILGYSSNIKPKSAK